MTLWKVFANYFDEYSPDIGIDGPAAQWVEPNDVKFSFYFEFFLFIVDIVVLFYINCFLDIVQSKWLTPEKYFLMMTKLKVFFQLIVEFLYSLMTGGTQLT